MKSLLNILLANLSFLSLYVLFEKSFSCPVIYLHVISNAHFIFDHLSFFTSLQDLNRNVLVTQQKLNLVNSQKIVNIYCLIFLCCTFLVGYSRTVNSLLTLFMLCKSMYLFLYDNGLRHERVDSGKNSAINSAENCFFSSYR